MKINDDEILNENLTTLDLVIILVKERLQILKEKRQIEAIANAVINLITKSNLNVRESKNRDFLIKALQLLFELGNLSRPVVCEWMYWYIDGTEMIR